MLKMILLKWRKTETLFFSFFLNFFAKYSMNKNLIVGLRCNQRTFSQNILIYEFLHAHRGSLSGGQVWLGVRGVPVGWKLIDCDLSPKKNVISVLCKTLFSVNDVSVSRRWHQNWNKTSRIRAKPWIFRLSFKVYGAVITLRKTM